jgi:hypothetical protein
MKRKGCIIKSNYCNYAASEVTAANQQSATPGDANVGRVIRLGEM